MDYKPEGVTYCSCGQGWVLETATIPFKGTSQELKEYSLRTGRKWNHCYCGKPLYQVKA